MPIYLRESPRESPGIALEGGRGITGGPLGPRESRLGAAYTYRNQTINHKSKSIRNHYRRCSIEWEG